MVWIFCLQNSQRNAPRIECQCLNKAWRTEQSTGSASRLLLRMVDCWIGQSLLNVGAKRVASRAIEERTTAPGTTLWKEANGKGIHTLRLLEVMWHDIFSFSDISEFLCTWFLLAGFRFLLFWQEHGKLKLFTGYCSLSLCLLFACSFPF